MSESEQSLLLRFQGDASSVKSVAAETRAAIAALRSSFASDAGQMQSAGAAALSSISDNLNVFVGQRIPLVGGAFVRITENLQGFIDGSKTGVADLKTFEATVTGLAEKTGKTASAVKEFLTTFVQIKPQAERDAAAVRFLGAAFDEKLIPQLEKAGAQLLVVTEQSAASAGALAGIAGPAGLAALGILATAAAVGLLAKGMFDLAVWTADFQSKMQTMSQQLGISVETLSAFEILAKTTGADLGSITSSLGIFQRKLQEAQDPQSKTAGLMKSLGIETENTEEALRQALTVVARMPEGFKQTALAMELFGRGGKSILAIIKEMGGDLDAAIAKFREMGILISTEDAQAANTFTGQLALLDFQMRALWATVAKEFIPGLTTAVKELSTAIKENKDVVDALGGALGTLVNVHLTAFHGWLNLASAASSKASEFMQSLRAATVTYALGLDIARKALIALHEEQSKRVTPGEFTGGAEGVKDTKLEQQSQEVSLNTIKNAATEAKQIGIAALEAVDQAFERGQVTRREQILQTMRLMRENEKFQQEALVSEMARQEAIKASDPTKVAEADERIDNVRSQARMTRRQLEIDISKQQALLDAEQKNQQIRQIQESVNAFKNAADVKLRINEQYVSSFQRTELEGLAITRKVTEEKFAVDEAGLNRQLVLAGKNQDARAKINEQLKQIETERTKFRIDNEEQVRQAVEKINAGSIESEKRRLDTIQQLSQISADGSIAALKAREELQSRIQISIAEETERKILAVKLKAKDIEIEAMQARLTAADAIQDPVERAAERQRLNDAIKVLTKERVEIEAQGARDIDEGHEQDLDNERKWADELIRIRERVNDTERESSRTMIDLMVLNRVRRIEIQRAQSAAEEESERDHHQKVLDHIASERKKGRDEAELNKLREAEERRHRLAMKRIAEQAAEDERKAGPIGGFLGGLESGRLATLENGIQSFADVATVAFSAVGSVVNGLAQGLGGLVEQWVLMGELGPNAVRKMVASVLASLAAQAAVEALMELARGFAALASPLTAWQAPLHFKAAAIFGLVAGAAAVAGRVVAGDSFKQGAPGGGSGGSAGSGSGGAGSSSSSASAGPQTINMGRQQVTVVINMHGEIATDAFRTKIIGAVVAGVNDNHPQLRTAIKKVGG